MAGSVGKTPVQEWLQHLSGYERAFKSWEARVEKILKDYRDESTNRSGSKFNILWSNVQTLVPATFSRLPRPDVSRRFRDQDPVGRVAALILERALDFEVQHYQDFRATLKQSVYDRFLGGRGTAWARYEPHVKPQEQLAPEGSNEESQITEDAELPEQIDYECAPVDYVHWKDFGHSVGRTWEEVTRVWRRVYMTMPAKIERFGEDVAKKIPLDSKPEPRRQQGDDADDGSWVYEGWDKETKTACWFHKNMTEYLDEKPDPLGLEGFFPCPRPLYATLTNDKLEPVPDYALYQDQAKSLNTLATRIDENLKMIQVKGVYDASADKSLARLFTEGNNGALVPVKNWAQFAEKNGLKGQIDVVDITPIANAIKVQFEVFQQLIEQIYQVTGLSDIVRGQTDANETATAQQIKGQFASLRLKNMQEDVSLYATELLQLKAQIMCSKFDAETLKKVAAVEQLQPGDQQFVEPALHLLLGDRMFDPTSTSPNPLRSLRIEVAADTLVQLDEEQEKQRRVEFLTANATFMEKAVMAMNQAGAAAPILGPLIMEMWKFGVTGFKVGKTVEGVFDEAAEKLKQLAQQPPPPPKPDPKEQVAQIEAQVARQTAPLHARSEMARAHADEMDANARVIESQNRVQEAAIQASMPQVPPGALQ